MDKKEVVKEINEIFESQGVFIPFALIDYFDGNFLYALVFAQVMYWETKPDTMWEYKTVEAIADQLKMNYKRFHRILKTLEKMECVFTERSRGIFKIVRPNPKTVKGIKELLVRQEEEDNHSTRVEYTSQNVEYTSQNVEYTSQNVEYTSQNVEYTSQNVEYTSQNVECQPTQPIEAQGIPAPLDYIIIRLHEIKNKIRGDYNNIIAPPIFFNFFDFFDSFDFFNKFSEPARPEKIENKPEKIENKPEKIENPENLDSILWNPKIQVSVSNENKNGKPEIENCAANPHLSVQPVNQIPDDQILDDQSQPDNQFSVMPRFQDGSVKNDLGVRLSTLIEEVKKRECGEWFLNELKALGWNDQEDNFYNNEALATLPREFGGFEAAARVLQEFRKIEPDYRIRYPIKDTYWWYSLVKYISRVLTYKALRETICSELNLPDKLGKLDTDARSTVDRFLDDLCRNSRNSEVVFWVVYEFSRKYPKVKLRSLDDWGTFRMVFNWINSWWLQGRYGVDFASFNSLDEIFEYCVDRAFPKGAVKEVLLNWYYYKLPSDTPPDTTIGEIETMVEDFDFLKKTLIADRFRKRLQKRSQSTQSANQT